MQTQLLQWKGQNCFFNAAFSTVVVRPTREKSLRKSRWAEYFATCEFAEMQNSHCEGKFCHISPTLRQKIYRENARGWKQSEKSCWRLSGLDAVLSGLQWAVSSLCNSCTGLCHEEEAGRLWLSTKIHALTAILLKHLDSMWWTVHRVWGFQSYSFIVKDRTHTALNPPACSLQGKFTGEICHFMVYHSYHHLLFSLLMVEGDFLLVKKPSQQLNGCAH